jgi:uncharacterized protein (DUF1330 family)
MKISVYPQAEALQGLFESTDDAPVVMLNLLKFKDEASSPCEGATGEEAYARYAASMGGIVEGAGGRFLWMGKVDRQVIGSSDVAFDAVALVEYPSRQAFAAIATDPRVLEIGVFREAGLEGQWLIACTTGRLAG